MDVVKTPTVTVESAPTKSFDEAYREALSEAAAVVAAHSVDGENDVVPIEQVFPHGDQDIMFMVYMKACRAIGYQKAGNAKKVRDEAVDMINYAAFLIAWYTLHPDE